MEENINTSEKIDRYILGQMNEKEKAAFEVELSSDASLKHEYELQHEIILAAQRVHLKAHLKNIEEQIRLKRKKLIKAVSTWTVAASILCGSGLGLDMKYSADLAEASMICYKMTNEPTARSGGEIDELLPQIYALIDTDELEYALEKINIAEGLINEVLKESAVTEEELYYKEIALMQKQDIEWYNALILMKRGEIFKSRKALKNIVSSNSRYAEQAREILETNYPF